MTPAGKPVQDGPARGRAGGAGVDPTAFGPARRTPLHPGEFLRSRFMEPLGITQQQLAQALGISRRRVNELIRGHRGISADTALRLAAFFRTDAAFWLSLQMAWDMHEARKRMRAAAVAPGGGRP